MGHRIDKLALLALLAGCLYVFFIGAMGSIPLAAASAFFAMAILRKLAGGLPASRIRARRDRMAEAEHELEQLALTDAESARKRITNAIEKAYPGQLDSAGTGFVLRHPAGPKLSADEVISEWRRLRDYEKAVIICLNEASSGAENMAARLDKPELTLIDGPRLVPLLATCPEGRNADVFFRKPSHISRFGRMALAAGKANAGKCVFTGVFMCVLFFISGAPAYLAGALGLLFIAGVSFHKKRLPGKLFGN